MKQRTPHLYLILVLLISQPFYALGDRPLFPGALPYIPATALMVLVPATVAFALCIREGGLASARALAIRAFEIPKGASALWLIPAAIALPGAMMAAALLFPELETAAAPVPARGGLELGFSAALMLVLAVAEEIGWMGYAADPLQRRFGAPYASVVIGLTWASWHWIPWYSLHGSIEWIFWQTLLNVVLRAWTLEIYNKSDRNVPVAAVFHASFNVGFGALALIGSSYDPMATLLVVAALTCIPVAAMKSAASN